MDDRRFDQWTRSLDVFRSRRVIGKLLSGSLLGAVVAPPVIAARCRALGRTCNRRHPRQLTCCGPATCRGKRCRCPRGRPSCGKTCCPRGHVCAAGQCVTGKADCPASADTCTADLPVSCTDDPNCFCFQRLQGGTRCGMFLPEGSSCGQCATDDDCRTNIGFPPGSSCVRVNGPRCCPGEPLGFCVLPCGFPLT